VQRRLVRTRRRLTAHRRSLRSIQEIWTDPRHAGTPGTDHAHPADTGRDAMQPTATNGGARSTSRADGPGRPHVPRIQSRRTRHRTFIAVQTPAPDPAERPLTARCVGHRRGATANRALCRQRSPRLEGHRVSSGRPDRRRSLVADRRPRRRRPTRAPRLQRLPLPRPPGTPAGGHPDDQPRPYSWAWPSGRRRTTRADARHHPRCAWIQHEQQRHADPVIWANRQWSSNGSLRGTPNRTTRSLGAERDRDNRRSSQAMHGAPFHRDPPPARQ